MNKCLIIFYLLALYSSSYSLRGFDSLIKLSKLTEEENITEEIQINIKYNKDINMGNTYNFYFETDYNDTALNIFDISDIEEKTKFNTEMAFPIHMKYKITCHLWKIVDKNFKLFCQMIDEERSRFDSYLNSNLKKEEFTYKNYKIIINPPPSANKFNLNKLKPSLLLLYANEQIINLDNSQQLYELKFGIKEYNNQPLFLYSNEIKLYLDKCSEKDNYLICKIMKEDLEEILEYNNQKFDIYSYTDDNGFYLYRIELIYNIIINYNIIQKQNIYIGITKLAQKYIVGTNFIAYVTNITSISNIISGKFNIQKKYGSLMAPIYNYCYLKKTIKDPLLILCKGDFSKNYLGEIKEEVILNNSNIKYNFFIQPVVNNEKVDFNGYFITALFQFPKILDFHLSDELIINFMMEDLFFSKNFRLNIDSNNLKCSRYELLLKCTINRKHFENLKSGYYYTYHLSDDKSSSIIYDYSPTQVIIPDDGRIFINIKGRENKDSIIIEKNKILYFVTSFNNSEMNIFEKSDIDHINFNTTITDNNKNNYDIDCYFVEQNNVNLVIICNLKQDIINGTQKIILNEAQFSYKKYTIIVFSYDYINIELYNCTIPFLYSNPQFINIKEQEEYYYLKFYIKSYNNEVLMIYDLDTNMKYSILDSCQLDNEILNCKISKEKLEEILSINNENFGIKTINDEGIFQLRFIQNLTINYNIITKKDIFFGDVKMISGITEEGIPIAVKTNVTSIPNLNTIIYNYCYFKKTKNNPLYILCLYKGGSSYTQLKLDSEKVLAQIHYKYNFRLQPYLINSPVKVSKYGTGIYQTYPDELYFNNQNIDSIQLIMGNPLYGGNISLNNENPIYNSLNPYLNCENKKGTKKCNISLSYFPNSYNREFDFYYIYHSYEGDLKIDYGVSPIKIIFPYKSNKSNESTESNPDSDNYFIYILIGSIVGGLLIIGIIIFIVLRCKRKRVNGDELKNKIISDIPTAIELKENI